MYCVIRVNFERTRWESLWKGYYSYGYSVHKCKILRLSKSIILGELGGNTPHSQHNPHSLSLLGRGSRLIVQHSWIPGVALVGNPHHDHNNKQLTTELE